MRVGIISLLHESNSFIERQTTFADFQRDLLLTGEAVRQRLAPAHHEVGGFFAGLDGRAEAVPLFAARALPYGVISAETFAELLEMMWSAVDQAGPLDGYLVAPHGATVSQRYSDADGFWLEQLRQRVGADTAIISTLDPHANLSQRMLAATDAIIAYRTNPHLDQRQRGSEAANMMVRTLRGEIQPTQAAAMPAMAINIECQRTDTAPCNELYEFADRMLQLPAVLSNSILLGFPYADVAEMGSAAVVVTDGNRIRAQELANEMGDYLWAQRNSLAGEFIDVKTALDDALHLPGPVCLLDMGDNVGGGAPGDGTVLAHAIHNRGIANAFVCLCDPEAVRVADEVGVGGRVDMRIGGKTDEQHGSPLELCVTVVRFTDGHFEEPNRTHGGIGIFDQGRTAVVRTDGGLSLMLTTNRVAPFSLHQLIHAGIDPREFRLIVAKGVHAPIAAYAAVCQQFIRVDTPGVTTTDMRRLPYQHRRRPMFPFES